MSDSSASRAFNTVAVPAALVFPDDPPPNLGHDAARLPVRVVWREAEAEAAEAAAGSAPATAATPPAPPIMPPGQPDAPPPAPAASSGQERPPSPRSAGGDPIARFVEINDGLDRIGGAAPPHGSGAAAGEREPAATMDNGVDATIRGARSADAFDQHALEEVGDRTKNISNSTAGAPGLRGG